MNYFYILREYIALYIKRRQYNKYVVPYIERNKRNGMENSPDINISVFSNPRGGSTWLSELLSTLPKTAIIWEPMNIQNAYKELKDAAFCWNQFIPENEEWPEAVTYFQKLYDKKIDAFRLYEVNNDDMRSIPQSKYFIFKYVGANMFLPWLTKTFHDTRSIYLIRHPCAVVSSQLRYRHLFDDVINNPRNSFPRGRYNNDLIDLYKDIFNKVTNGEERLAAEWAITNLIPVNSEGNDIRWVTVCYERLYIDYETEMNRIFSRLQIERPAESYGVSRKASQTAIASSVGHIDSGKQLDLWRKHLSSTQIRNILNIVKEFGVDFYDDSSEPDYSKIYKNHPVLLAAH